VLVDGDDGLGGLHAGEVLDRAGDAQCDVEVRGDGDTGLTDLGGVLDVAGVDGGAGGADCGSEAVGEVVDQREALRGTEAAAAGDDGLGAEQGRTLGVDHGGLAADDRRGTTLGGGHRQGAEGAGGGVGTRVDGTEPHGDRRRAEGGGGDQLVVAAVDGVVADDALVVAGDVDHVGDQCPAGTDGEAGGDVTALDGVGEQDGLRGAGLVGTDDGIDGGATELVGGDLGGEDLRGTELTEAGGRGGGVGVGGVEEQGHRGAQGACCTEELCGVGGDTAVHRGGHDGEDGIVCELHGCS